MGDLEDQLADAEATLTTANERLAAAQTELKDAQQKVDELAAQADSLQGQLDELLANDPDNPEIENLRTQLAELDAPLATARDELATATADHDAANTAQQEAQPRATTCPAR